MSLPSTAETKLSVVSSMVPMAPRYPPGANPLTGNAQRVLGRLRSGPGMLVA